MKKSRDKDARQRLMQIILENSFKLGEFTLASGKKSDYYIDCRTTTLHPEGSAIIVRLMVPILEEWDIQQVGGLTLGADPIVSVISMGTSDPAILGRQVPAFIVRKQTKQHGRANKIEGCFEKGLRTAIIEDVITTGGSALKALEAAAEAGAKVSGVIAVVDREEGGREAIESRGHPVRALFTASELKQEAKKSGQ